MEPKRIRNYPTKLNPENENKNFNKTLNKSKINTDNIHSRSKSGQRLKDTNSPLVK